MVPGSQGTKVPTLTTPTPTREFRPDIEGLRAVAIALVVGFHAGVPWLAGGYIGVDIFFVLSGYLITRVLVAEALETGTINLVRFYSRRIRRLLPALICVLAITGALTIVVYPPVEQTSFASAGTSAAAYVSNVYFARIAGDYHGVVAQRYPTLHTWTLSVEEQFYAFWPLLVILGLGAARTKRLELQRRRLVKFMLVVAIVSLALSLYLTKARQPWAFFLLPPRAWEFAVGGLGAIVAGRRIFGPLDGPRREWMIVRVIPWLGMGGILVSGIEFSETMSFPGFAVLLPVISTISILCGLAAQPGLALGRLLSLRPFQIVGRLSYSWYLWHWPVLVIGGAALGSKSILVRSGLVVVSFLLAYASYTWVESPIRNQKRIPLGPRSSVAYAGAVTSLIVVSTLLWRQASIVWSNTPAQLAFLTARESPRIYSMGCFSLFYETTVKECVFGNPHAARTVVLLGDSHAAQWFPAVETAFSSDWKLVVMTKAGCSMPLVAFYYWPIKRSYSECELWRSRALAKVRERRPELVIVASSYIYPIVPAQWRFGTKRLLTALASSAGTIVLLRDTPRPLVDVPACLAKVSWLPRIYAGRGCRAEPDTAGLRVFKLQREVAAQFSNVRVVDLNDRICDPSGCDFVGRGTIPFRDTEHLAVALARDLAPFLLICIDSGCRSDPASNRLNDGHPAHGGLRPN